MITVTHHTWHPVEVVDATAVVDFQLLQKKRLDKPDLEQRCHHWSQEYDWQHEWMMEQESSCLNPQTERRPAKAPTMRAPPGVTIMSAQAPTATPPARVAFWVQCTIVRI